MHRACGLFGAQVCQVVLTSICTTTTKTGSIIQHALCFTRMQTREMHDTRSGQGSKGFPLE